MAAGAAGARLTGAGFGGSIIAVCGAREERAVADALLECAGPGSTFAATPGEGAGVRPI